MEPPVIELPIAPLPPPAAPVRVSAWRGLLWLQQGFRMFVAQPGRWTLVLGIWLWVMIILPGMLSLALRLVQKAALLAAAPLGLDDTLGPLFAMLPALVPLAMILLFPLIFAGLMIGCAAVARGEPLRPQHLLAGFSHDPSRLVTVGGINAVGQILLSGVILAVFPEGMLENLQSAFDAPETPANVARMAELLADVTPYFVPVVVLQTLLMAALWFTPPLLAFHDMRVMSALRGSIVACARNAASLAVYAVSVMVMLSVIGGLIYASRLDAGTGGEMVLLTVISLAALSAVLTTVIGSVYVAYREIFRRAS